MSAPSGHHPTGMCAAEPTVSVPFEEGPPGRKSGTNERAVSTAGEAQQPISFDSVYEAHFGFVWRALRGLGVPAAHVDDAAQEVFVVVHRRLETLEDKGALKAWLWGIARRVAKDHRRATIRRGPSIEFDPERSQSAEHDPERQNVERQSIHMISDYAANLDEERRELFFLVLIEGMPISEAADLLGANANTTYSRVRTMRREMMHLLGVPVAKGEPDGSIE